MHHHLQKNFLESSVFVLVQKNPWIRVEGKKLQVICQNGIVQTFIYFSISSGDSLVEDLVNLSWKMNHVHSISGRVERQIFHRKLG